MACAVNRRILIITHRGDLHADLIAERIAARGLAPFRIDLDRFPADYALDLHLDHGAWTGELQHLPSGDALDIARIGAVWTRKTAEFAYLSETLGAQERAFAHQEMEHILFGLLYGLDAFWMSHPSAVRGALWKGEQLMRAAKFGFDVPASDITNSPGSARAFHAAADGDIVFKALASPTLGAERVQETERVNAGLPTTRIGREHDAMFDAVAQLPCFFQHYIAKRYELRVTVIDGRVFAAKIHSQDDPRTAVDFRDFSAPIRYQAETLPLEIERRCRDFVASYSLTYGAIDLIVAPDGRYVFLENNPGGQFLFVEQLVPELKMLDALAECLIAGAERGA
jgi:glutathione synthase/RimK-type ligase-like ATP-grasp enzyme